MLKEENEKEKGKRKSLEMRKEKDKYIETSATQKTTGYLRFTHVGVCVCRVCRVITCWKRCVNERSSKAKKKHKKGSRKRVKLSGPSPAAKNLEPITPKNIVPPIVFSPPQKKMQRICTFFLPSSPKTFINVNRLGQKILFLKPNVITGGF